MSRVDHVQPGLTCWSGEKTHRLALVDAAAYFRLVRNALLRVRHSVRFIGREVDRLDPSEPLPGFPNKLGAFLPALIGRRPSPAGMGAWDLGFVGTQLRGNTPIVKPEQSPDRLRYRDLAIRCVRQ